MKKGFLIFRISLIYLYHLFIEIINYYLINSNYLKKWLDYLLNMGNCIFKQTKVKPIDTKQNINKGPPKKGFNNIIKEDKISYYPGQCLPGKVS